jgi:hypothetical protein
VAAMDGELERMNDNTRQAGKQLNKASQNFGREQQQIALQRLVCMCG